LDASTAECRELLDRVVNSRELKRALRLRELLLYIGKQAQDSPAHVIREQEIGAAVFGRPEEYDTSLDNIVRVNVSELRKRLAHFFQEEGVSESIIIEIPRGGYLPIFLPRPQVSEEKPMDLLGESVPPLPTVVDRPADQPSHTSRSPRVYVIPLIAGLVLSIAACGFLLRQNSRLAVQLQPWKADSFRDSFLADFFGAGEHVDIVTADTSFALTEDILGQSISLDDYLDYKYKDLADQPNLPAGTKSALKHVLERNNGSIGDFQVAKRFMDLDAHASNVRLASARSYTAENIKTNNVILIGGRESNPWVDLYKDRMNFFMEYEPNGQRSYIANRNPKPGENPVYETLKDKNRSYSVVTFMPNLDAQNFALIISGTDSQATRAAGEFVTSVDGLTQIRQKMPTGRFPYFEVVLSSARLSGTTLRTEIVAYRVHER
jgi:hypothetical protein